MAAKTRKKIDAVQSLAYYPYDEAYRSLQVPAVIQVGDTIKIRGTKAFSGKVLVVEVSEYIIVVRSDNGFTLTLLRYNPNAVAQPDARGIRYKQWGGSRQASHRKAS